MSEREKNGKMCPVCGKFKFEYDDFFEVCDVCGWEDDGLQRDDPDYEGGANVMSLNQMRKAYAKGLDKNAAAEAYENGERWEND